MIDARNQVIRVVEENVDGCGSDAIVYVEFSKPVDNEIVDRFTKELETNKSFTPCEDRDTDEMVEDACAIFNQSDFAKEHSITATIADVPYYAIVTF